MDKKQIKMASIIAGSSIILSTFGYIYYKFIPKMPLKKYTEYCLYLAVMDDEICRNELEGTFIDEKEVVFPPKSESVQYRYHLFLSMYKTYSRKKLEQEIDALEIRLEESRTQFLG
ncbi:MAG: hypothetical protein ACK5MV_06380 [Aminipila sp.]